MCFDIAFGQKGAKSIGTISLEVKSNYDSTSIFFDVPVNERLPILHGDELGVEESETGNTWQLISIAVADKNNAEKALSKVTLIVSENRKKTKIIRKKLKLKKGQKEHFQLKYKNLFYEINAFYKPENK